LATVQAAPELQQTAQWRGMVLISVWRHQPSAMVRTCSVSGWADGRLFHIVGSWNAKRGWHASWCLYSCLWQLNTACFVHPAQWTRLLFIGQQGRKTETDYIQWNKTHSKEQLHSDIVLKGLPNTFDSITLR